MTDDELIAEARRLGEPTSGDGWRRLLWQLGDRLDALRDCLRRFGVEDVDILTPDEAGQMFGQWQADWDRAARDSAELHNLRRAVGAAGREKGGRP